MRVARNKELARRRAIEQAGLDRFGAMQHAGFDTMIRRPVGVRRLRAKLRFMRTGLHILRRSGALVA